MKINKLIIPALFFVIFQSNPIFAKSVFIGIRGEFAQSNFAFDTPGSHSILKWNDMKNKGYGVDLGYHLNDTLGLYANYTRLASKGEGVDDDIMNVESLTKEGYPEATISHQKASGIANDFRGGLNLGLFNGASTRISGRFGYFNKNLVLKLNDDIYKFAAAIDQYSGVTKYWEFNKNNGMGQRTNSRFNGATIGFKIDQFMSNDAITSLIIDFYPVVSYKGKQFWPQREIEAQRWFLKNANNNSRGGFIQFQHQIRLVDNIWFKIYANYEKIKVFRLKEFSVGEKITGGSAGTFSQGKTDFESLNGGVGLVF